MNDIDSERQRVRHLFVVEDTAGRRPILLEAATYSIGRDPTNSIVLYSKLVSRQHAILLRVTAPESSAYLFRIIDGDLQGKRSTNGMLVNGHRCYSHDLKQGDMIVFGGDVRARYYVVSNLSNDEFAHFFDTSDLSGILSQAPNPFQTLVPFEEREQADFSEAALVRLASYPELTPNPILEMDLSGIVTYLNPAAVLQFPDVQKLGQEHPILAGLLPMVEQVKQSGEKFFLREVELGDRVYEQHVHYIFESELIRSYITDITDRKRAEEQLRQQAQREAVINRIVQAMRGTMVASEVLQITANLLLQALQVNHCLIIQEGTIATINAPEGSVSEQQPWQTVNEHFLRHYQTSLAQGNQVFVASSDGNLATEMLALCRACQITTLVITPLLYLGRYLGSISLYQSSLNSESLPDRPRYHSSPLIREELLATQDRLWTLDELSLVRTIADQCAIAIHQARLYQQVQELNTDLERQVRERTAELEQKMQELERLNALKDDFLSTVSHELRTPMANIKMAIHMLKQFPLGERQERYLKILANECSRETELINDLLDLQRLEAGTNPIGLELIDLEDWLPNVLEPFQNRTQQRKQTMEIEYPANLPCLKSNRHALERVIAELLNNACKYTPAGGRVSFRLRQLSSDMICFQVTNQSEIPTAELPRIFDKFYRIPNADPWKQGGTGLGLALVKKLVEQLRGQIVVSSELGETTFLVELPLGLDAA